MDTGNSFYILIYTSIFVTENDMMMMKPIKHKTTSGQNSVEKTNGKELKGKTGSHKISNC